MAYFKDLSKKETSLQLQGIMNIKIQKVQFHHRIVFEVSSFVGNPVFHEHFSKYIFLDKIMDNSKMDMARTFHR